MTTWLVQYVPYFKADLDEPTDIAREIPRFRIFPEGEPERWIAITNEDLPSEVQEEAALIMAAALNKALES